METEKYLYGAAIQGIQPFIFQSNELSEIGAASALVDKVCKDLFASCLYPDSPNPMEELKNDCGAIINAAGHIKYLFDKREDCEKVVLSFPKKVNEILPGVSISQAVEVVDDLTKVNVKVSDIEQKLRVQRNKPMRNPSLGFMGVIRSRKTGLPAVDCVSKGKDVDFRDSGTIKKQEYPRKEIYSKALGVSVRNKQLPWNISQIEGFHSWVAIIHADGNNLGQVVRKVSKNLEDYEVFSRQMEIATCKAANMAFADMDEKYGLTEEEVIPIRPVILGGDDLTVICRADLAVDFAKCFIEHFQNETEHSEIGRILRDNKVFASGNCLTACAGIAFVKSSYPFYYGYTLAEDLCHAAKLDAREMGEPDCATPSCIMFHKVQDSFISSYDDIAKRELNLDAQKTFKHGPYYLDSVSGRETVGKLQTIVDKLSKENKVAKNGLRQWVTLMTEQKYSAAEQFLRRLLVIQEKSDNILRSLTTPSERKSNTGGQHVNTYAAYDALSLLSIQKPQ